MKKVISCSVISAVLFCAGNGFSITTDSTPTAEDLVYEMLGENITVDNIILTCVERASGTFRDGETAVRLTEGIILSTGNIANVIGPNDSRGLELDSGIQSGNNAPGDADLSALIDGVTNDACVLEFDYQVVPAPGLITASVAFNYVFASEEYNEYVDQFNDAFAFFIDDENIALIPGTETAVSINNVNQEDNSEFYINNDDCQNNPASCPVPDTQMDGLTTVFSTAEIEVVPGQSYHLKLVIADALDYVLDSNVFIPHGSFKIVSNEPPEAQCKDSVLNLDSNGQAVLTSSQVDNGSFDPDADLENGDPITLSLSKTNFNCSDMGTQHAVTLTVTDDGGLSNTCVANVTVVDDLPPVPNAASLPQVNGECSATVTATPTATDNCAGTVTGTTSNPLSYSDQGTHIVTWTFDDGNGNTSTQTQQVVVADVTGPNVLTKNITVLLNAAGSVSINPDAVDNGTSDACGIASLSVDPSSFTCGDVGNNTVTLTAIDVNGNTNSATAIVTVVDNVAPVVVTKNITVQLTDGTASISVADVNNGSLDACGIAGLSVTPNTFTSDNLGDNTVTLTATDVNGNTSSATATVTVQDVTPPVLVVSEDVTVEMQNAAGTVVPLTPTATDTCDADVKITGDELEVYPLGVTTVTFTATDDSGNSTTGSMTVTVQGPTEIKENSKSCLSDHVDESERFGEAIKMINRSLNDKYWMDATHLYCKNGEQVFEHEADAVRQLMLLINKGGSNTIVAGARRFGGFMLSGGEEISDEALACADLAVEKLVRVDRILAETFIFEAKNVPVLRKKERVAEEIADAHEDLDKGDDYRGAAKFDRAIHSYKKAWDHACDAVQHAASKKVRRSLRWR